MLSCVCRWDWLVPLLSAPVTARSVQGMARVRSGQAPAWPLSSDPSVRRDSRTKRDVACTFIPEGAGRCQAGFRPAVSHPQSRLQSMVD
jgi:hypothetical protein